MNQHLSQDAAVHQWQRLTRQANADFEAGALQTAHWAYAQALELALAHFGEWPSADDAVAAVVVSYLNLSEAQSRLGLQAEACHSLVSVHRGLVYALNDADMAPCLRCAALDHLPHTAAALVRHQEVWGKQAEAQAALGMGGWPAQQDNRLTEQASPWTSTLHPPAGRRLH